MNNTHDLKFNLQPSAADGEGGTMDKITGFLGNTPDSKYALQLSTINDTEFLAVFARKTEYLPSWNPVNLNVLSMKNDSVPLGDSMVFLDDRTSTNQKIRGWLADCLPVYVRYEQDKTIAFSSTQDVFPSFSPQDEIGRIYPPEDSEKAPILIPGFHKLPTDILNAARNIGRELGVSEVHVNVPFVIQDLVRTPAKLNSFIENPQAFVTAFEQSNNIKLSEAETKAIIALGTDKSAQLQKLINMP
jgi:hypothetical protein